MPVMALTITAADNQDGTGMTVTAAGSDPGQTVSVYAAPVGDGFTPSWALYGTRTGDGTLTVAPGVGYWHLYATGTVSAAAAVSVPVMGVASLAETAVFTQIKAGVQARIQSLSLVTLTATPITLPSSHVYNLTEPSKGAFGKLAMPAVIVSAPPRGSETVPGILNNKDDIGYPVLVAILDRTSPQDLVPVSTYEKWREQIFRALRYQRIATAPTVFTVYPEPGPMAEWKHPEYMGFWSSIVFRAISREPRGA